MGKKSVIYFLGVKYEGYRSLADEWNAGRRKQFHTSSARVEINIRNWRKKNPGVKLNDLVIEECLMSRAKKNAIHFQGDYFSGPKSLHEYLISRGQCDTGYKNFFYKLDMWRRSNPGRALADSDILTFAKEVREKTKSGSRVGFERARWDELPKPKVSWSQMTKKLRAFKVANGRPPSEFEFCEIARPCFQWLDGDGVSQYRHLDGSTYSRDEFYKAIPGEKVDPQTFKVRVRKQRDRMGRNLTPDEAINLLRPFGRVDRSVGILYLLKNKINGKEYVGITTETLSERMRGHQRTAEVGSNPKLGLHFAIKSFGFDSFSIKVMGKFKTLRDLASAECKAIAERNTIAPNGYNLDPGGKGVSLRSRPIVFDSKRYKNLKALADDFHVPVKRLESRLRLGWSLEEALTLPKGNQRSNPYRKLTQNSLAHVERELGLSKGILHERLSAGWSWEEATEKAPRPRVGRRAHSVVVAGVEFASHARAAKHFGVPEGTWRKRIKSGWTPNQAAGVEERPS